MTWFDNLKIRTKLIISFILIITLVALMALFSILKLHSLEEDFTFIIEHPIWAKANWLTFRGAKGDLHSAVVEITTYAGKESAEQIEAHYIDALKFYQEGERCLDGYYNDISTHPRFTPEEKAPRLALLAEIRAIYQDYKNYVLEPVVAAARAGDREKAFEVLGNSVVYIEALDERLDVMIAAASNAAETQRMDATNSAHNIVLLFYNTFAVVVLIALILAVFISSYIARPVKKLLEIVSSVSRGEVDIKKDTAKITKDEIGNLTGDLYILIDVIKRMVGDLTQFHQEVEIKGDIEFRIDISKYEGSFKEVMAGANDVAMALRSIEKAAADADRAAHESEIAKARAEAATEVFVSSITYASKIQRNLLPEETAFQAAFSDYSVIWEPRDIVGGDIYWMKNFDEGSVLCLCDCTGHGTPGALLTMLIASVLETAVSQYNYYDTAEIIWQLEQGLVSAFSVRSDERELSGTDIHDGCDLAVLFIANDGSVAFSAGNISVFVCDGKEMRRIKGQKIFVGEGKLTSKDEIKTVVIPANLENKFYLASDGLFSQPGGIHSTPFGYKLFEQIIMENHAEKQSVISDKIRTAFKEYQGSEPNVDDVTLITFKPEKKDIIIKAINETEIDLFENEQQIYDKAAFSIESIRRGGSFDPEEYAALTLEYGWLLKQLRRATRISDKTTTKLHKSNLNLSEQVFFDTLTNIYNRRYIEENMIRIIKSLSRSGGQLSVMMIDIDFFKNYNDTYGHSKGDVCLKMVAETLVESLLRADDFAVRYGGEEFLIVLPNTNKDGACMIADRVLENIRAMDILHEKSEAAPYVTVSVGVTTSDVEHTQNVDDYIKRADEAMYLSKQNGRNRYTFIEFEEESK